MTPAQFWAVCKLIRMRGELSIKAARMVLVDGEHPVAAGLEVGISKSGVRHAVRRVSVAHGLIVEAYVE